jgi:hypothetical protein
MKRISYTSLLLLVVLFSLAFTGCVIKDDGYYDPPPQQTGYQYIFNEDFTNDTRGWAFDDQPDSAYALVSNGYYKFVDYSYTGGYHMAVIPTGANTARDFLVQTRLRSNYAMALIFGASNSDKGYSFFIDEQGYFAVFKEGTTVQTIVDWQQSSAIHTGTSSWNDVELEQVGNYWYGYINGVKVFQIQAGYLSGAQFGFMVLANTTGYADYLTVKW